MIRVALEATSLCKAVHTGIQKYTKDLLESLARRAVDAPDLQLTALYKLSHREHAYRRMAEDGLHNRWYIGNGLPVFGRYDVMHVLDMRLPSVFGAKLVTTVYDLAVFLEDHQFDAYSPGRFRRRKRAKYERLFGKSAAVVAISESTKRDIVTLFGYPEEQIQVIYPGLSPRMLVEPDADSGRAVMVKHRLAPKGYCLFVGSPNQRKNADRAIDAFMMSSASKETELILLGNPAYSDQSVQMRLENRTISKKVRFIGYAKDDELQALYSHARAFVFPTLYEGFGLPILEALACGVPAVIGNRGAAPEAGGALAIQVDPYSVESIAQGIDRAVHDEAFDPESARAWARTFDWDRAAAQHLALYRGLRGMT
jgi:glycosyltransferase involved in cell wall biosynthesis